MKVFTRPIKVSGALLLDKEPHKIEREQ